jgi:hypothetical protein
MDAVTPIGFTKEQDDDFIKSVLEVKRNIESRGYTILDTMQPIYATDKEGNKISSEADIILVNEQGDIQVIDVTYGYGSVRARLVRPRTEKVTLDPIYQNEDAILTNIEDVVNNTANVKFKLKGMKSEEVAKYTINHLNKFYITPGIGVGVSRIVMQLLPSSLTAKIIYNIQRKKIYNKKEK